MSKEGRKVQEQAAETEAPPTPTPPLDGDILETILSHVPLPDLVPASYVSKSWKRMVSTSLLYTNPPKPWLLLHKQCIHPPYSTSFHAYDHRSHLWFDIKNPQQQQPINPHFATTLRASHSSLLYTFSLCKLSFSFDPLHLTWHHVTPPLTLRIDPIVALVGKRHLVVAGGLCDFEDNPLSVDIYDLKTRKWDTCESFPALFKDSASSTWLSFAASNDKLLVVDKNSGQAYAFDPSTKAWNGPYCLVPDRNNVELCCCLIGWDNDRLIVVGMFGSEGDGKVTRVKLWELDDKSFVVRRERGEMPKTLVEKLGAEMFSVKSSISMCFVGELLHLVNGNAPEDVFFYETSAGGWGSVRNAAVVVDGDTSRLKERLVFSCFRVGIEDLEKAMFRRKMTFAAK